MPSAVTIADHQRGARGRFSGRRPRQASLAHGGRREKPALHNRLAAATASENAMMGACCVKPIELFPWLCTRPALCVMIG